MDDGHLLGQLAARSAIAIGIAAESTYGSVRLPLEDGIATSDEDVSDRRVGKCAWAGARQGRTIEKQESALVVRGSASINSWTTGLSRGHVTLADAGDERGRANIHVYSSDCAPTTRGSEIGAAPPKQIGGHSSVEDDLAGDRRCNDAAGVDGGALGGPAGVFGLGLASGERLVALLTRRLRWCRDAVAERLRS